MKPSLTAAVAARPRALILENHALRVVVLPNWAAGVEHVYKPLDRELLWRTPRAAKAGPVRSVLDDVWCGGWEELFPNDVPPPSWARSIPTTARSGHRMDWAAETRRVGDGVAHLRNADQRVPPRKALTLRR